MEFENGDYVLLKHHDRLPKLDKKFSSKFVGPFRIKIDSSVPREHSNIYPCRDLADNDKVLHVPSEHVIPFSVPVVGLDQVDTAQDATAHDKRQLPICGCTF